MKRSTGKRLLPRYFIDHFNPLELKRFIVILYKDQQWDQITNPHKKTFWLDCYENETAEQVETIDLFL